MQPGQTLGIQRRPLQYLQLQVTGLRALSHHPIQQLTDCIWLLQALLADVDVYPQSGLRRCGAKRDNVARGLAHHEVIDRRAQPDFLGKTDEITWKNQTPLRVVPADQRFETNDLQLRTRHHRLIEQGQFLTLQGSPKLTFQMTSFRGFLLRQPDWMTQLLFALRHVSGDREGALCEVAELASLGIATGMRQTCADMLGGYLADYVAQLAAQPDADEAQLHFLRSVMNRDRAARASASELSKRETDVLRALATGGSDKELARELGISDHGVRFHLKGVFKKLGVHDRLSAVVRAQEKGWI